jgi:hypothetical protein
MTPLFVRNAIVELKQPLQRPVIGWVTKIIYPELLCASEGTDNSVIGATVKYCQSNQCSMVKSIRLRIYRWSLTVLYSLTCCTHSCPGCISSNIDLSSIFRAQCTQRAIAEVKQRWSVMRCVTKKMFSRIPPCFRRHVKPLISKAFAVIAPKVKSNRNISKIIS